jgi:hypothetical protein
MGTNAITLNHEIEELKRIKENLLTEVIELDDKILFQDFGVYEPQFSFSSSDEYKKRLNEIREEQKLLIKRGLAAKCYKNWKVNGSEKEGKKLIA